MALKKRTEIHSDTVEFDKYIHSNSDNFFTILNRENVKNGAKSSEIQSAIKGIKQTVVNAVQEEINFFISLENQLLSEVNKKGHSFTRKTYLEELRKIRILFTQNSEYSAFIFNDLKEGLSKTKSVKDYQKAVKAEVMQPISKTKFEEQFRKEAKKNKTGKDQNAINIAFKDYLDSMQAAVTAQKSDFENLIAEIEKETSAIKILVIDRFADLINYISSFYDITTDKATDPTLDKISNTSAGKVIELAKSFGFDYKPGDVLEEVLKDFKKELLSLGSEKFFREFHSSDGVQYYDKYVEAFQFASRLGFLYELAIRDSIIKLIQERNVLSVIFLDAQDVRTLGASKATETNPIDVSVAKIKKNGREVFLGLSLKLKDDPSIKLEGTNVEDFVWKQQEFLSGSSAQAYKYVKRNLKALNTHDNNSNSAELTSLTKDFLIFEKEFVVLAIMNRWLAGLFKKIGENQYRSVDKEGNDSFTEDLYTAFIYDAHDVYSVADILKGILEVIASGDKDMSTVIGLNLSGQFGNVSTKDNLNSSVYKLKDRTQLKKLYEEKQKVFSNLSNITYALLLADSNISSMIKSMDSELDSLTFSRVVTLSLNVNNIKKIVGGL